jgi:hypothetical protein
VTLKLIVQVAFAPIVKSVKVKAVGVKVVTAGTQLCVTVPKTAVTPAGKASLTVTLVSGVPLGLVMVRTTFEVLPGRMVDGVKVFVIVGGAAADAGAANPMLSNTAAIQAAAIQGNEPWRRSLDITEVEALNNEQTASVAFAKEAVTAIPVVTINRPKALRTVPAPFYILQRK